MQTDCPLQVVTVLVAGGQIGSSRGQRSTEIVHEIIVFFVSCMTVPKVPNSRIGA